MDSMSTPKSKHTRQRVFVLVDDDEAQGVFNSWDAAEAYAEKHDLSLDRLMEYQTDPDHPDHLHLMAASWGEGWEFVGQWTKRAPIWRKPPLKVRLDHYHLKQGAFTLLRQKEFFWRPALMDQVNTMAPDSAMAPRETTKPHPPQKSQWKPKISPLKPLEKPHTPPAVPPGKPGAPLMTEGEEPVREKPEAEEAAPGSQPEKTKPRLADMVEKAPEKPAAHSGIEFQKKSRLRLRANKADPKPIPVYGNPPPAEEKESLPGKSTVELAQMEMAQPVEGTADESGEGGEVRRIIPLRLIIPVIAVFIFWGLGIFYVFRPEPKAQKMLPEITTLARAEVLIIEPGQVFFEMPIDPVNQHRWVDSLELDPVNVEDPIAIPTQHTLETWEKPQGFIRPPYAAVEVSEWWDLRLRKVSYGFYHRWDDGSILILDLEADILIGWAEISRLPELLN